MSEEGSVKSTVTKKIPRMKLPVMKTGRMPGPTKAVVKTLKMFSDDLKVYEVDVTK